jgi:dienelactone hydrolase
MMSIRFLLTAWLLVWSATISASEVRFPSAKFESSDPDVQVSGQLFVPDVAGPRPAVVLLHACGGLRPHVTQDWPEFLKGLGYVVLTVDTLGSHGNHRDCRSLQDRHAIQARDAYGALDYLSTLNVVDRDKIAAVGFSMGGRAINQVIMARNPRPAGNTEFRALVSVYARCTGMQAKTIRKAPLLQIVAERDEHIAPECIEAAKSVNMEIHVIPGAHHAFDQSAFTRPREDYTGNMMLYDAVASEKARGLVGDFLGKILR